MEKKACIGGQQNSAVCSCKVSLRKEKGKTLTGRKIHPEEAYLTGLETG